jgi:hypothetical protein
MTYDLYVVCGLVNYVYLWQHPCSLCMSPKQSLKEVEKKFDHWIEKGMQALVMKMLTSTKKGCWFVVQQEFGACSKG